MSPRVNTILEGFAAGEISPRMRGRISAAAYQNGVSYSMNMVPDPRGPLMRRGGSQHIYRVTGQTQASTFSFVSRNNKSFSVLFVDSNVYVHEIGDDGNIITTHPIASPYLAADLEGIQAEQIPGGIQMFFVHQDHTPQQLLYDVVADTFTFTAITFTSPPAEWVAGSYPSTVTTLQGRSWWAGTPDDPVTFWASVSASYTDLTLGTGDSDAFKLNVNSSRGRIEWIAGTKSLLIGATDGEFVVSSETGVISINDFQIEQQSANGSSSVVPVGIGTETLYISPDGRKLETMWYAWTESGWKTSDLSFVSEHITEGKVIDMAYARNPDSIVLLGMEDGELVCCSYRKPSGENAVIGWHRHQLGGDILSVSAVEKNGTSWPVIAIGVNSEVHLVLIQNIAAQSETYLDDYTYASGSSITTVTGLDYLEGLTVGVVADGGTHADKVVAGGEIDLDAPADEVYVGLRFSSAMRTLPLAAIGAQGELLHAKKRRNKIYVRLFESARPIINGDRPSTRSPATPMDTPEPFISEDVFVIDLGWEDNGEIEIEQDLPVPMNIINIMGEAAYEQL